jgi:hypothetical protein
VRFDGTRSALVVVAPDLDLREGQAVTVQLPPEHLRLWRP